jgi:uncharacterized protein YdaT
MPWTAKDAVKKTKKAKTPKQQSQWAAVANKLLASGASDGSAITQANGVVKKRAAMPKGSC